MKTPLFNLSSLPFKNDKRYQGFSNSATAIFKLYIDNDREIHEKCQVLKFNPPLLKKYLQETRIKIDSWCEGRVWLDEIVKEICGEF